MQTGETKSALRAAALLRRNSLPREQALVLSGKIQSRALRLPLYNAVQSVALYSPIQNEVRTEEIRVHALEHGKTVFYPRSDSSTALELVQVTSGSELRRGRFGVLEPTDGKTVLEHDPECLVVFVPGLAFDKQGQRLGRGHGGYDRLLLRIRDRAIFVGLAYELQICPQVPCDRWDQKVHYIITERRIIDCTESGLQSRSVR